MYQVAGATTAAAAVTAAGQAAGLAMTGFAFGLYLTIALMLIVTGVILRHVAAVKPS